MNKNSFLIFLNLIFNFIMNLTSVDCISKRRKKTQFFQGFYIFVIHNVQCIISFVKNPSLFIVIVVSIYILST